MTGGRKWFSSYSVMVKTENFLRLPKSNCEQGLTSPLRGFGGSHAADESGSK